MPLRRGHEPFLLDAVGAVSAPTLTAQVRNIDIHWGKGIDQIWTGMEIIRRHVADYISERDGSPADWRNVMLCAGFSLASCLLPLSLLLKVGSFISFVSHCHISQTHIGPNSSFSQNAAIICRSQRGYPRRYEADDEPRGCKLKEARGDDPHPPVSALQCQPCRVQHGAGASFSSGLKSDRHTSLSPKNYC